MDDVHCGLYVKVLLYHVLTNYVCVMLLYYMQIRGWRWEWTVKLMV